MARRRPPRVRGFAYLGCHAYFLTICVEHRRTTFTDATIARSVRACFLQLATVHQLAVLAYCLMPDHLHSLLLGLNDRTDFRRFVFAFKQRTGFEYGRQSSDRLWQEGFYDHVLRNDESLVGVAAYILNNPVRAGLCRTIHEYAHLGSDRYTLQELSDAV